MNLDSVPRQDYVTVDAHLSPVGRQMINLLNPQQKMMVEWRGARHAVQVPLGPHAIAILRRQPSAEG